MHKSVRTYFVTAALLTAPLLWSGCSSDNPTKSDTMLKPRTIYYTVMSEGQKTGYQVIDFRIEGSKAISELNAFTPIRDGAGKIAWERMMVMRHVETLDGRPLSHHIDLPKIHACTSTIGEDGKLRIVRTNYSTTNPSPAEEVVAWPEDALLNHGSNLLALRKGFDEGTEYTFKNYSDAKGIPVHVRVGPRKKMKIDGQEMELIELIHTWDHSFDNSSNNAPQKMILYVDNNMITYKIILEIGPEPWISTITACSKAEAIKPPETLPR
ncbi:MAG: hypothetical protein GY794_01185 [bacterium]|nr:hypothetical protein [bacterium]